MANAIVHRVEPRISSNGEYCLGFRLKNSKIKTFDIKFISEILKVSLYKKINPFEFQIEV